MGRGRVVHNQRMIGTNARRAGIDTRTLPVYEAGAAQMPHVITGMDEYVDRDTSWTPHSHPTHELLWNRYGASTATIGPRTWTITPVIGLWIPAGTLHSASAPAGTWYRTSHIDVRTTSPLPSEPVAVEMTPLLTLLLERLVEDHLDANSRELTEMMVFDVLTPSRHALLVQRPDAPLLQPIVTALIAHPGDPRTLTDWATRLGVSERTVTRTFRTETGLSFGAWQAAFRAQHASVLLGSGVPVDEVATAVGYRSASAFGAAFRRTTGLTPGAFRAAGSRPDVPNSDTGHPTQPNAAHVPLSGSLDPAS